MLFVLHYIRKIVEEAMKRCILHLYPQIGNNLALFCFLILEDKLDIYRNSFFFFKILLKIAFNLRFKIFEVDTSKHTLPIMLRSLCEYHFLSVVLHLSSDQIVKISCCLQQ